MTEYRTAFDIPTDMRRVAEQSVDQARRAFEGLMTMAQRTTVAWEEQSNAARTGAKDMGQKAMSFATQNVMTSLDFAQRVVRAKDLQEVMQIQAEYIQSQMRFFAEQAKELGEAATKTAADIGKPKA